MKWMLGIFAVVGVLVIGFAVAVASGLVDLGGLDPFKNANASTQPATRPAEGDASAEQATDSEASLAALKNPGYEARVVYLSAADAKLNGSRIRFERTGSGYFNPRGGSAVDPKNRLPNGLIRGWTGPEDSVEWTFNCPQAGRYVVTFDCIAGGYGGSRGHGVAGGKFEITSGDQKLVKEVAADVRGRHGYSSSYHLIDVGEINLSAGQITLKVQPAEKDSGLLAIRSVRLYPAE